jgi:predicted TPR repeat methyltransferase
MNETRKFLDGAYGLEGAVKTQEFYRQWAKTYDAEITENGYASPTRTAAAMASLVPDLTRPLLDLGCGTGISGEAFQQAGFTTIDGTDFSEEMLAAAKTKNIYRRLSQGDLNQPIPAQKGEYSSIVAVGVFSPGHAPAHLIEQVLELLPSKGYLGFSLNDHALEGGEFEQKIQELLNRTQIEIAFEEYGDHLPGIGLKSKIFVLQKP